MKEFNEVSEQNFEEELKLSTKGIGFLRETAKWAKFLSIVGFVGMGLMVLSGIVMSITMSSVMPGGLAIGLVYVVMAVVYFFPILYLFKFSNDLKEALDCNNNSQLDLALENLKSHYKFIGIFTIVIFGIYALMIVFGLLAALVS